jgi:hypothetical protein
MNSLISAATSAVSNKNMDLNGLTNAATSAVDENALSDAAGNKQQIANIASVIQDKPNLEDRVSEALLKLLTKDKFIESMSSNISSILKTEILKPAFKEQLDKVKNIIAEVEKLECNKNKDVVNDKIKNAKNVANTIQNTIDRVDKTNKEDSDKTNQEDSDKTNQEDSDKTNQEKSDKTNPEESELVVDENNIKLEVEPTEEPVTNVEENPVEGGKAKKSRRKNTKKSRKSRRNKRRN